MKNLRSIPEYIYYILKPLTLGLIYGNTRKKEKRKNKKKIKKKGEMADRR